MCKISLKKIEAKPLEQKLLPTPQLFTLQNPFDLPEHQYYEAKAPLPSPFYAVSFDEPLLGTNPYFGVQDLESFPFPQTNLVPQQTYEEELPLQQVASQTQFVPFSNAPFELEPSYPPSPTEDDITSVEQSCDSSYHNSDVERSPSPTPAHFDEEKVGKDGKKKSSNPRNQPSTVDKRERNRLAAEKYRRKGRELISTLEKKCQDLIKENGNLVNRNKTLEDEIAYLHGVLARSGLIPQMQALPGSQSSAFVF